MEVEKTLTLIKKYAESIDQSAGPESNAALVACIQYMFHYMQRTQDDDSDADAANEGTWNQADAVDRMQVTAKIQMLVKLGILPSY